MQKIHSLNALTLTDVEAARDYLKLPTSEHDDMLAMIVNAASGACETYLDRLVRSRAHTFYLSGEGDREILVPQYPVTAVASAAYLEYGDGAQTETALDVTHWHASDAGILYLRHDAFPCGTKNIKLAATCGFTDVGYPRELSEIEIACLMVVQVMYQDWLNQPGRTVESGAGSMIVRLTPGKFPKGAADILNPYKRRMM